MAVLCSILGSHVQKDHPGKCLPPDLRTLTHMGPVTHSKLHALL